MRPFAHASVALALLALLGAIPGRSTALDDGRPTYAVAAIGDSLTEARTIGGGFMDELAERCAGSRFDNYAKGGQLVRRMRSRFASEVLGDAAAGRYTHVIVFGGVNDILSDQTDGRTVQDIAADLSEMYAAARARGAKVVAITLSPWSAFKKHNDTRRAMTLELNAWIRSQAERGAVDHAIDAYALLACGEPSALCASYMPPFKDGLHFGAQGHRVLADALVQHVFSSCAR